MSRIKVLRANPRRTLAALATLLIAVGITAASGATFSAQTVNPSNTFSSGTISMTQHEGRRGDPDRVEPEAGRPGPDRSRSTSPNTGSLAGAIKLSKTALTDSDAGRWRGCSTSIVTDCGADARLRRRRLDDSTTVYTGTARRDEHDHGARHLRRRAWRTSTSSPSPSTRPRRQRLPGQDRDASDFTWDAA